MLHDGFGIASFFSTKMLIHNSFWIHCVVDFPGYWLHCFNSSKSSTSELSDRIVESWRDYFVCAPPFSVEPFLIARGYSGRWGLIGRNRGSCIISDRDRTSLSQDKIILSKTSRDFFAFFAIFKFHRYKSQSESHFKFNFLFRDNAFNISVGSESPENFDHWRGWSAWPGSGTCITKFLRHRKCHFERC